MIQSISSTCAWCEMKQTFDGDDPEKEWRTSGWLIFLDESGVEKEFCSLSCCVSYL